MSGIEIDNDVGRLDHGYIPADWGIQDYHTGIPSKEEQEKKSASLPASWYADSIATHPKNIVHGAAESTNSIVPSKQVLFGWSSSDTQSSAEGTEKTEESSSSWWGSMIGGLKNLMGLSSAEESQAAVQVDESQAVSSSWYEYLNPSGVMTGVSDMVKGLWGTITFAETAFSDPNVKSVEIPVTNPDGTANPFGGRRITRDDYRELLRFRDDTQELMDRLTAAEKDGNLEALIVALTKALATDKEDEFDYQKKKLAESHKERDADLKLRDKASVQLLSRIKDNRWWDWFYESTTQTSLAFGGLALGVASGVWGWALPMIAFSGVGLVNSYLNSGIEKSAASVTAKPTSWIFGSDYQETVSRHTEKWKTAHKVFWWAMTLAAPGMIAASNIGAVGEGLVKALFGGFGIMQNLGQSRKVYLHDQTRKLQAEIDYRHDRLREAEKSISSGISGLTSTYKSYSSTWKEGQRMLKQTARLVKSFFMKN